MSLPHNHIPSAELPSLFPGIDQNLPLEISSVLFSYGAREMPLLLPIEQAVLAAIVRFTRPRRILEFGTAQGQTTFALAANSPPASEVFTLDITEWTDYTRKCLRGDDTIGACYRNSPHASKVRQLFRVEPDDLPKELSERRGTFDYLHIDGDHTYSGVKIDTLAALDLAAPDAVFTWHDFYSFPDYVRQPPEQRGVFPYLNELAQEGGITLRRIVGTYLVVGSRSWPKDMPGVLLQPGEATPPFGERNVRLGDTGWK